MNSGPAAPTRPKDVDTAFGLWLAALPLMLIGQAAVPPLARNVPPGVMTYVAAWGVLVLLSAVVVTFLLLMRQGYRWAARCSPERRGHGRLCCQQPVHRRARRNGRGDVRDHRGSSDRCRQPVGCTRRTARRVTCFSRGELRLVRS